MAVLNAGFERGASAATISTAAAQADGDAWDTVTIGTAAAAVYDSTNVMFGAQAGKFSTAGTAAAVNVRWIAKLGTVTDHYGRIYMYWSALPAGSTKVIDSLSGASVAASVRVQITTGLIVLLDSAAAVKATSVNAIATGQWIRLEYHFVHSATAGSMELKLFNTATATDPTETITPVLNGSLNTLASADRILFGSNSSVANNGPFWMDQIQAGASAYPGPAVAGLGNHGALTGVGP